MKKINGEDLINLGFYCCKDEDAHFYEKGMINIKHNFYDYYVRIICPMQWVDLPHIKYMEEIEQLYYLLHGKKLKAVK
jgi:hypothetical protein